MLDTWNIILLSTTGVEEFLFRYDDGIRMTISGTKINGTWVVTHSVYGGEFANGAMDVKTHFSDSYKEVVKNYVGENINRLCLYGQSNTAKRLLIYMKNYLE